jgi:5-formyltetrahydrofolate cyclo-ligase
MSATDAPAGTATADATSAATAGTATAGTATAGATPAEDGLRRAKKSLRARIDGVLRGLPEERFSLAGRRAADIIADLGEWRQARKVLLFLSMGCEIDTEALCLRALGEGKDVFVPRVRAGELEFHRILSMDGPWDQGPYGIREPRGPSPGAGFEASLASSLIVLPGVAFDRRGGRLGHGKGYYDRFLARLEALAPGRLRTVGICLAEQLVEEVPMSPLDRRLAKVCAESDLIAPAFP